MCSQAIDETKGVDSPLFRFASLVAAAAAAAEREACAVLVENYCGAWDDQGYALAQAIRARGQK
jgi:hypothetical protein